MTNQDRNQLCDQIKQVVTKTPLSPVDEALFAWMQEITALLCYQPDVPMKHKEDLCKSLNSYGLVITASKLTGYDRVGKIKT